MSVSMSASRRTLPTAAGAVLAGLGIGLEVPLFLVLLDDEPGLAAPAWLAAHAAAATLAGTGLALLAAARSRTAAPRWLVPCIAICVALPLMGGIGLGGTLLAGIGLANSRRGRTDHWQTIDPIGLPFAPPAPRPVPHHDTRGLDEQLRHSRDVDTLYRRVLAAASMRDALSIGALKRAVGHEDDRVRLTAYQTIDTKVTRLNREIQRLEAGVERLADRTGAGSADPVAARERSTAWLQIAANYRELLTLEEAEPVARRQLLDKASTAARRAVAARPDNRSAHYTLGQLALLRGDLPLADAALERAIALGMSPDTVAPRLAESAFLARDFARARRLMAGIDPAHRAYPPMRALAEHWA